MQSASAPAAWIARSVEILTMASVAAMLGVVLFGLYEAAMTACLQMRVSKFCLADKPFGFWMLVGLLGLGALMAVGALSIYASVWRDRLQHWRNRRAQGRQ